MRKAIAAIALLLFCSPCLEASTNGAAPQLVSPGSARAEGEVANSCPTFSWSLVPEAAGYELRLYTARSPGEDAGAPAKPLLEIALPAGVTSWTPSLEQCLPRAGRYGWTVGARQASGEISWSAPSVLRLAPAAAPHTPRGPGALSNPTAPSALPAPSVVRPPSGVGREPRSLGGEAFSPGTCTGSVFSDVTSGPYCPWIEQLERDAISDGCGGGNYCPTAPVTREQLALYLERVMHGTDTWSPVNGPGAPTMVPPAGPVITMHNITPADSGEFSSITIGRDGLGLMAFHEAPAESLKVLHCSNLECSAADSITPLETAAQVGTLISITIGTDGLGLISYYAQTEGGLKVAHCADVNCTSATKTLVVPTTVGGTSITVGSDGFGVVAFYDTTDQSLKVLHCTNATCGTFDPPQTLDNPVGAGALAGPSPSIAIGTDGMPLIAYLFYDGIGSHEVRVKHCTSLDCATSGAYQTIDNTSDYFDVALTIGADGLALMSYVNYSNIDLQVAHCADLGCTVGTDKYTLDSTGFVGPDSSITIGPDGLGLISYGDASNTALKVAHCNDLVCSKAVLSTLDPNGAQDTSITIGADGLALISWYANEQLKPKVAHCSNQLCAPYFRRR